MFADLYRGNWVRDYQVNEQKVSHEEEAAPMELLDQSEQYIEEDLQENPNQVKYKFLKRKQTY